MGCHQCESKAIGVCVDCGLALCGSHGTIIDGHRSIATGNLMEQRRVAARWFVCEVDVHAHLAG